MYKFEQVDQLARCLEMYYDDPTCRWEHYERMADDLYESGCRYMPDEDELLDQIACLEQDIADVKSRTVREMAERIKDAMNNVSRWSFHNDPNEYFIIGKPLIDQIANEMLEEDA